MITARKGKKRNKNNIKNDPFNNKDYRRYLKNKEKRNKYKIENKKSYLLIIIVSLSLLSLLAYSLI